MKSRIVVNRIQHSIVIECIRNHIHRLFLIKIPNRFHRYFQYRRYLFQNVGIDLFALFERGDSLLVPIAAELEGEHVLFDSEHFAEPFHVAAFVDLRVGGSMCHTGAISLKRQFI